MQRVYSRRMPRKPKAPKGAGQRVVFLNGQASMLLHGDGDLASPRYQNNALPLLLHEGWRIESISGPYVVLTGGEPPAPIASAPTPPTITATPYGVDDYDSMLRGRK